MGQMRTVKKIPYALTNFECMTAPDKIQLKEWKEKRDAIALL